VELGELNRRWTYLDGCTGSEIENLEIEEISRGATKPG
jgi:hypothetical protein